MVFTKEHKSGMTGKFHSIKSKRKISLALKGKKLGEENPAKRPEVRKKISEACMGRIPFIKGKTYKEYYGLKKANDIKNKISINKKGVNLMEKSSNWKNGIQNSGGYVYIHLDKKKYPYLPLDYKGCIKRANLIWFQNTGEIIKSPYILHHRNKNRSDDRFNNLKRVTQSIHAKLENKTKKRGKNGRFIKTI